MQALARQAADQQAAVRAAANDLVRQAAAQQQAARDAAAQELAERQTAEARREQLLQAIGRQLNAEADQRQAEAEAAARLPRSVSSQRRIKLFGRSNANAELVNYAEAWARKIQMNTPAETVRELARQPHTHPVVTVAIRSDGSVESVRLELSSGQPAIDAAIERIVRGQASYPAFSTLLASQYDVVEIRRTWQFDTAVRLY
jgi:outer membrane biosynthesis protein TonB